MKQNQWQNIQSAVMRFAGDSGDGVQLIGGQFLRAFASMGNDYVSFPDFPAEIRAPVGTTYGVSSFQIHFGERPIHTIGDSIDVLLCFNAAALKTNLADLIKGGLLIVDSSQFSERNLRKAGYEANPLEDGSLQEYNLLPLDITSLTMRAVADFELGNKMAQRSKNLWALGLSLWLFKRGLQPIETWLSEKFATDKNLAQANIAAMRAGYGFGDISEIALPENRATQGFAPVKFDRGHYRNVTGTQALALGLVAAGVQSGLDMLFASYPITPASALLHEVAKLQDCGIRSFQAEDEIGSVAAAIGASYAGMFGVTSSSGPGIALKSEAIGLAFMAELPLLVINTQRGGPSTGLPTKTEQADLGQAIFGRNGDSTIPVIAVDSPSGSFLSALWAVKLAVEFMTPVFLLSDGFLASSSQVWKLPELESLPSITPPFATDPSNYQPYKRNENLARAWAIPGQSGFVHRIGGLEKSDNSGDVSYDPDNHQRMSELRNGKLSRIAELLPLQEVALGGKRGLAVIGWGSSFGSIHRSVSNAIESGFEVSHIHVEYLSPFPRNLESLLSGFDEILVVEMNLGQLRMLLQSALGRKLHGLNCVTGRPIKVSQISDKIRSIMGGDS